jgi:histone H3/H4
MSELPSAPVKRILVKNGASRLSSGALVKAADAAESFLAALAKKATVHAEVAKRKTIMDEDVEKAAKELTSTWTVSTSGGFGGPH